MILDYELDLVSLINATGEASNVYVGHDISTAVHLEED